jgi:AraC-like DNA-binding protein
MQKAAEAPYLFPAGARLREDNLILHASARRHSVSEYAGPLSIKTVLRGQVSWMVAGRPLVVDTASFLVLAEGERYSMEIDALTPVETCCAFFATRFVERIAIDLTSPLACALDVPDRVAPDMHYLSTLHSDRERSLTKRVRFLAACCEGAINPSSTEEQFLQLGVALLDYYDEIRAQATRVPATREATRQELFRRLLVAREYIHAHVSNEISLKAVARAACLSPFHFHRGFTQAFQRTPHQYVTELRLAQARDMIFDGLSVLDACVAVGFSSPSAFSRLFRKRFGQPPLTMRREFARLGKQAVAHSGIFES